MLLDCIKWYSLSPYSPNGLRQRFIYHDPGNSNTEVCRCTWRKRQPLTCRCGNWQVSSVHDAIARYPTQQQQGSRCAIPKRYMFSKVRVKASKWVTCVYKQPRSNRGSLGVSWDIDQWQLAYKLGHLFWLVGFTVPRDPTVINILMTWVWPIFLALASLCVLFSANACSQRVVTTYRQRACAVH